MFLMSGDLTGLCLYIYWELKSEMKLDRDTQKKKEMEWKRGREAKICFLDSDSAIEYRNNLNGPHAHLVYNYISIKNFL